MKIYQGNTGEVRMALLELWCLPVVTTLFERGQRKGFRAGSADSLSPGQAISSCSVPSL